MNLCKKSIVLVVCCLVALTMVHAQSKKESKAAAKFRTQGEQARNAVEQVREQLDKTLQAYEALLV